MLGNLCSNSVDPNSALTKRLLLQAGAERALLGCLHAEEAHTLTFACAALQNLCHEPVWSELVMAHGKQARLEELTLHDDPMVVRYASGALKNIQVTLKDSSQAAPPISQKAADAIRQRSLQAELEELTYRHAAKRIGRAVSSATRPQRQPPTPPLPSPLSTQSTPHRL